MKLSTNKLIKNVLILFYFSRYILTTIPAQGLLYLLFLKRPALPLKFFVYLLMVVCYWCVVISFGLTKYQVQHYLFFFSFIPPLLALLSMKPRAFPILFIADRFITLMFVMIVVEAVLANSPLVRFMYFFPQDVMSSERVKLLGFYQRPLGLSNSASMTACVVIFSSVLSDVVRRIFPEGLDGFKLTATKLQNHDQNSFFTRKNLYVTLSIILLASGTGFLLLVLYFLNMWLAQMKLKGNKLNLKSGIRFTGLSFVIALAIYVSIASSKSDWREREKLSFDKFSLNYAALVFELKFANIGTLLERQNRDVSLLLFGTQVDPDNKQATTSSDFGYYNMYGATGLFGSLLILLLPWFFFSSIFGSFFVPTVFFYLSFLHYPGLLSPPGAVLFALYIYLMFRHEQARSLKKAVATTQFVGSARPEAAPA